MSSMEERGRVSRRQIIQAGGAAAAITGLAALPFAATRAAAQGTWDREADVIVVGTGAAGTPAAIEAARAGAQVIRLEKVEAVGGNMSHSQGIIYLGGGTSTQQQHGFDDTPDAMFAYLEAFMSPWDDPDFIWKYVDNSVEHHDWLMASGIEFGTEFFPQKVITAGNGEGGLGFCGNEANYPYNEITPPMPRAHCVTGYGAGMSEALQAVADAEPNITTEVNAPVTQLITDDTGRVIGVVANISGVEEQILARQGVILCSGGYEMNEEMLVHTKAAEYPLVPQGSAYRGNTGDGIRMAAGLGARLRDMDNTFSTPFVYPPDEKIHSVLVNGKGRRFANEASYGAVLGDIIVYHEDNTAWLIMDQTVADSVAATGADVSEPFATADTLEELADLIGVPPASLANEIAFYNEQAANGVDPVFHKSEEFLTPLTTAPYLAFNFTAYMPFLTTGHVQIDLDGHVLDQDGEIIPGLFAAGQNGAGIGRRFYNSGIRLGEGSFFGRVAGKSAASNSAWDDTGNVNTPVLAAPVASGTPAASPVAAVSVDDAEIVVTAVDLAFDVAEITIAADTDVTVALMNEGLLPHDFAIEDTDLASPLAYPDDMVGLVINLPAGEYVFYCTVPGHREAGMVGTLIVE